MHDVHVSIMVWSSFARLMSSSPSLYICKFLRHRFTSLVSELFSSADKNREMFSSRQCITATLLDRNIPSNNSRLFLALKNNLQCLYCNGETAIYRCSLLLLVEVLSFLFVFLLNMARISNSCFCLLLILVIRKSNGHHYFEGSDPIYKISYDNLTIILR